MLSAIHESPRFREASGPTLRPGGLELTERAVELCRLPDGAELLDVGCGSGVTVEYLRNTHGFNVCGIDISLQLITEGRERSPELLLIQGRAEALPFEDCSLDGVFCECVLSLLQEPVMAIREFYRVLRPGGKLVISDLYLRRQSPGHEQGCSPHRETGIISREEISSRLSREGFNGPLIWEDHTWKLTELAARIMLAHGNLDCLSELCECGGEKPGYFLMITEKP